MKVSIKDISYLFNDSKYLLLGHGTGRSLDGDDVILSIFTNGLRTKDGSLYYTTTGLDTSNIDDLINRLKSWPHLNSKKIILMRLPIEYINIKGESADLGGERFGAFTYKKENDTYYLDPKFIIGCFDVDSSLVTLNDKFEEELTRDSIETLKSGYKRCLQKTKERHEKLDNLFPFDAHMEDDTLKFDHKETKLF